MKPYAERPHILVVDDDERIRDLVCRYLSDHGFVTLPAEDAEVARQMMDQFVIDAIVLDVMMPGESGVAFTESLREKKRTENIPVLLLTAMGEARDRIDGLSAGADDYLPKPFEPEELVLRLKSILKRAPDQSEDMPRYKIGPWMFDPADKVLSQSDADSVALTDLEVSLLVALAKNAQGAVSRDDLSMACGVKAGERTIDVQITRLRKKFEKDTKTPQYLQTVRGKGYMLIAEKMSGS